MVKGDTSKLKKGGLDTIVAYVVVMLPLLYVLVYMVATIYHFSVQTYMSQVVKEATVMASTYGKVTTAHENYIKEKLSGVLKKDEDGEICKITYYIRRFGTDPNEPSMVGEISAPYDDPGKLNAKKADIIGIHVVSTMPSMLGNVSSFSIFGGTKDKSKLYYTSYREEIIRNECPQ